VIMHVVLDLGIGVDDPKSRKLSLPQLEIANLRVGVDFLKEIFTSTMV
jgi:hypothetical protein